MQLSTAVLNAARRTIRRPRCMQLARPSDGACLSTDVSQRGSLESLVVVDKDPEKHTAIIRMNRPPVNSLSLELIEALRGAIVDLEKDDAIRGFVLASTSKVTQLSCLDPPPSATPAGEINPALIPPVDMAAGPPCCLTLSCCAVLPAGAPSKRLCFLPAWTSLRCTSQTTTDWRTSGNRCKTYGSSCMGLAWLPWPPLTDTLQPAGACW